MKYVELACPGFIPIVVLGNIDINFISFVIMWDYNDNILKYIW